MDISALIAVFILLAFILLGVGYLVYRRRAAHDTEVFEYGQIITAQVIEIENKEMTTIDQGITPHQAPRFFIKAEGIDPQTKQTRMFTSHPLLGIPEHIKVGGPVKVRIDTHNPKEYLVDIAA